MEELEFAEDDVNRTLDLAYGYLEEAENVLWNYSSETDSEDVAEACEELTREVWELQHRITDLQRKFE